MSLRKSIRILGLASAAMVLLGVIGAGAADTQDDIFAKITGLKPQSLDPGMRQRILEALAQVPGYRDCGKPLAECLAVARPSSNIRRLAAFTAGIISSGGQLKDAKDLMILRNYSLFSGPMVRIALDGYPPLGNGTKVQMVVYADFQCPFCAQLAPALRRLAEEHASGIRVYFKPWPIRGHPQAVEASKALFAASDQGKFWPMHDNLFENQQDLSPARVLAIAARIGCDMPRFKQALDDSGMRKKVEDSKREGVANGVEATPSIFLNGRQYFLDPTYEMLKGAIEELLESGD